MLRFILYSLSFLYLLSNWAWAGHISPPVRLGAYCAEEVFSLDWPDQPSALAGAQFESFEAPKYEEGAQAEPLRQKLINSFNQFHAAIRVGDKESQERLRVMVPELFDQYQQKGSEIHSTDNPVMIWNSLWAGWFYAQGDFGQALRLDGIAYKADVQRGLQALSEEERKERCGIHFINMCSDLRKLANLEHSDEKRSQYLQKAFKHGKNAHTLAPNHTEFLIELALVLDDMGDPDGADGFLQMVLEHTRFDDPRDGLADRIRRERDLLRRTHLPTVVTFLQQLTK